MKRLERAGSSSTQIGVGSSRPPARRCAAHRGSCSPPIAAARVCHRARTLASRRDDELSATAAAHGRGLPGSPTPSRRSSRSCSLPLYTRHLTQRGLRHRRARCSRRSSCARSCSGSGWGRRSCASTTSTPTRSAGAPSPARATGTLLAITTVAALLLARVRRAAESQLLLGHRAGRRGARRRARPVGVHEPGAGLRAAAGGGARARLRDRRADQRRAHRHADRRARGRARPGRVRPRAGQLRGLAVVLARPVVVASAARRLGAPAWPQLGADAALRAADRAGRGVRVR